MLMLRTMLKVVDLLVELTSFTKGGVGGLRLDEKKHENRAVRGETKVGKGMWRKLCI